MIRLTLSLLALCAVACSSLPIAEMASFEESQGYYSLTTYLRSSNVPVLMSTDSSVSLENTPEVRIALSCYLDMTLTRRDVINNNIANTPTIHDFDSASSSIRPPRYQSNGEPYQRQRVILADGGMFKVEPIPRTGDPRFRRFAPTHPDGGEDGYIEYPEIDPEIEMDDLADAYQKYYLATVLIRALDSAFRIPDWEIAFDQTPAPPNAYGSPARPTHVLPPVLTHILDEQGTRQGTP